MKQDWILRAAPSGQLERIEAYFGGSGYGMHRHDTYAIGRTLSGVQMGLKVAGHDVGDGVGAALEYLAG